jgi:hypothetical protein
MNLHRRGYKGFGVVNLTNVPGVTRRVGIYAEHPMVPRTDPQRENLDFLAAGVVIENAQYRRAGTK